MPRPVSRVPDPWEPYKDGQIWEFTLDEIGAMPGFQPMVSSVDGASMGLRKIQWYVAGHYYVRFLGDEDLVDPDWLAWAAGWAHR